MQSKKHRTCSAVQLEKYMSCRQPPKFSSEITEALYEVESGHQRDHALRLDYCATCGDGKENGQGTVDANLNSEGLSRANDPATFCNSNS